MFRQFMKSLYPVRIARDKLARAVGGAGGGEDGVCSTRSAFERNCDSKEEQLSAALKRSLPGITYVSIEDISGGCGAMFEVNVEAKEFIGLSRVKQHRLVTDSLKEEIAEMHGIRIHTAPAPSGSKH